MPEIEHIDIADISPDPANLRAHPEKNRAAALASFRRFGAARSIVVDGKGVVRAGNASLEAARAAGIDRAIVVDADGDQLVVVRRKDWSDTEATAYGIADNRTTDLSEFDDTALAETLRALQSEDFDMDAVGYTDGEVDELLERLAGEIAGDASDDGGGDVARPSLADRFIVPPFSVLDARQGYWQDRKRQWLAMGISSELGRGGNALGREAECESYRDGDGDYEREREYVPGGRPGRRRG